MTVDHPRGQPPIPPELLALRDEWLAVAGDRSLVADEMTARLREIFIADGDGNVWRVDGRSSMFDAVFTRQVPGRVAERVSHALFVPTSAPFDKAAADAALVALNARTVGRRDDWTPRERNRALRSVRMWQMRDWRPVVSGDVEPLDAQLGRAVVVVVDGDGRVMVSFTATFEFRGGSWRLQHWPHV